MCSISGARHENACCSFRRNVVFRVHDVPGVPDVRAGAAVFAIKGPGRFEKSTQTCRREVPGDSASNTDPTESVPVGVCCPGDVGLGRFAMGVRRATGRSAAGAPGRLPVLRTLLLQAADDVVLVRSDLAVLVGRRRQPRAPDSSEPGALSFSAVQLSHYGEDHPDARGARGGGRRFCPFSYARRTCDARHARRRARGGEDGIYEGSGEGLRR